MEKPEFAIANVTPGRLNALVKTAMHQIGTQDPNEAVRLINSGKYEIREHVRGWEEYDDGVITTSVVTNGMNNEQWHEYLRLHDVRYESWPTENRTGAIPTSERIEKLGIEILRPGMLGFKGERDESNMRAQAYRLGLVDPNPDLLFLLRCKFTDEDLEEIGFSHILVMHEPIQGEIFGIRKGNLICSHPTPRQLYTSIGYAFCRP